VIGQTGEEAGSTESEIREVACGSDDECGDDQESRLRDTETRRGVGDLIIESGGKLNFITVGELLRFDEGAVDFDAVGAAEVVDDPMPPFIDQLAVMPGDLGIGDLDIAFLMSSDEDAILAEGDAIPVARGNEIAVGL